MIWILTQAVMQTRDPAFGALLQCQDIAAGQMADAHALAQEIIRFLRRKFQIRLADLNQLAAHPQARDRQGQILA
jgi:hypothetical protein